MRQKIINFGGEEPAIREKWVVRSGAAPILGPFSLGARRRIPARGGRRGVAPSRSRCALDGPAAIGRGGTLAGSSLSLLCCDPILHF